MRRFTIPAALAIVALVAVGTAAASARPDARPVKSRDAAEIFYRCPSGYAFEVSGNAAHCKKPAYTDRRSTAACAGLWPTYKQDAVNTKDMCAGTNPITGENLNEVGCKLEDVSQGYTKRVVAGRDYCGKLIPQQIQPPNVAVSLTV